jgi:hypothetical protein
VVGSYVGADSKGHGYLYDGTSYKTLDVPGAIGTYAAAVSGKNVVGQFGEDGTSYGFFYNGTSYKTLVVPGSTETIPQSVSGNNVGGKYTDDYRAGGTYSLCVAGHYSYRTAAMQMRFSCCSPSAPQLLLRDS